MLFKLPPPVFKYDVANLDEMNLRLQRWKDYDKLPHLNLRQIIVGEDALLRLPEALIALGVKPGSRLLVVMDDVQMLRCGESLKPLILSLLGESGHEVEQFILEGDAYGLVHADFAQVEAVLAKLRPELSVISIGSGVVTDITKHACFLYRECHFGRDLPYVSYMTAPSVPAYTSGSSIISKDGVKRSWPSRTPDIIIMDLPTLQATPYEFIVGGVGDTFPVFAAFADWYIADVMDYSSIVDASWRIYDDINELFLPYKYEIADRSSVGMEVLGKFIHNVGLSMSYAYDTTPASGFDHVIGHMLDMSAERDGRKVGIHGQQIGIAILLTLLHFEKLIATLDEIYNKSRELDIDACFPSENRMKQHIINVFAPFNRSMALECWSDFSQKLAAWQSKRPQLEQLIANWPQHKAALKTFLPHSALDCAKALEAMRHPLLFSELSEPISEDRAKWAMLNANLMRKRFTSADLAYFLGAMDEAWVDDVFLSLNNIADRIRAGRDRAVPL